MPLAHPHDRQDHGSERVSVNPVFTREPLEIPRLRLPDDEIDAETAYQVVHDELMLDGNARLNLATFVTTWMEPQARTLMAECFDKNMIDKDEYPRTAELEMRCVHILADPDWTQDLTERTTTVGEHTARALYEADYRDVDGAGEPLQQRYLVAFVFVSVGGQWLLLHDQCTPV